MNPLPKPVGWLATAVGLIAGLGTLFQLPFVHDFVVGNPKLNAVFTALVVIVAALSHSLPGDGGDGSQPRN